jgi:hypothetical protein
MLRKSTDCYVKRQQRFDVAICKTACVEDNRLETDVSCTSSGMDAVDRHETPICLAASRDLHQVCDFRFSRRQV